MVIMDAYYSPDRLQEIWQTIDDLHLSYLEMEESPEKLDHRMRLEECIREFLCLASHSQKFSFRETSDILYRSANSKKDFSGYKAATGWNAIQLYAGNLLSQPWRKEYKQIKTYCGFYKHQIEANLVGAEIMFEAMGYKHHSNGILILDGPICPDTVTSVSKDCLIAYVECQILKAIWEEITPSFKISWLEVLEFRQTHFCSPEQSIRSLSYQQHQKQYQAQNDLYSNRYHQTNAQYPHSQLRGHSHVAVQPLPYIYGNNGCCANNYTTYAHIPYSVPVQYPQHVMKPPYTNGYYCANGYVGQPQPLYGYGVPTGQLIELDAHHNGSCDMVDNPSTNLRLTRNSFINHEKKVNETKQFTNKEPDKEVPQYEDWGYVYRNLESQGYSKDLGERGDILNPPADHKKTKPTNLDEVMQNLTVTDRPLKVMDGENQQGEPQVIKKATEKKSPTSSYDNLPEMKKPSTSTTPIKTKIPLKEKTLGNSYHEISKTLNSTSASRKDMWECKACTFLNEANKDICDICSKSRINVEQQMEVGGPQCSKCTLVNSKDVKICQACNASLKDSPTYI